MKNSSESIHVTKVTLLIRTLFVCFVMFACCLIAPPSSAVGPAGDAQRAYDDWVAANEAVKAAKENLKTKKEKQARVMANTASGGITEGEQRALDKVRDEVAEAEAALKDAEAKLDAARIELEKAIAELEDEKLKKELIRKRDGYIESQRFTAIAPAKASVETKSGLQTVTFDTSPGRVIVNLPDDMRAGDTISGTVFTEPKGQTEEERAKNKATLNSYTLELKNPPVGKENDPLLNIKISEPSNNFTFTIPSNTGLAPLQPAPGQRIVAVVAGKHGAVGIELISGVRPIEIVAVVAGKHGAVGIELISGVRPTDITSPTTGGFNLPTFGQQGRPIEIFGPFDGNSSNTTLRFGPPGSTVQDFEKNTENVSGGFGLITTLVESPRKLVFECPSNVTGPVTILVKEGDGAPTTGTMRNLGVQLSAPKTNLMRGEKTTLTVEVRGLEGIKEDVPLQLDSKGVITMDQGNFQNLRIKPQEVTKDGRYTTNRTITGVQAGGFTVTATVIVRRFDFCLQDDSDPNRLFYFNSFTGDYIFACGGGSCRPGGSTGGTQTGGTTGKPGGTTQPGGTVQPGGTTPPGGTDTPPIVPPPPVTLTGTGRPAMKGCIITLSHNAPDRRVFARLDACTKSGEASVETSAPKTTRKITDTNITDNIVPGPPPK